MFRWLRFVYFLLQVRWRKKTVIALSAKIKFPRFVQVGRSCKIRPGCFLDAPGPGKLFIGDQVDLNRGVYLGAFGASLHIGDRTQLNRGASIDCRGIVRLGCDVLIGPDAKLIGYRHEFQDISVPINCQGITGGAIEIGNDVWIGANAIIMPGVTLGKGCVVGAGAVVTRSFPPFSVLAGVPAQVISVRGNQNPHRECVEVA